MADIPGPAAQKFVVYFPPVDLNIGRYTLTPLWWGMIPASAWSNEAHVHTQIEVSYVSKGEGEVLLAGRETIVRGGDVIIAFPGESHSVSSRGDSLLEMYFLAFDVNLRALNAGKSRPPRRETEIDRLVRMFLTGRERIRADGTAAAIGNTMSVIREAVQSKKPGWNEAVSDLSRVCLIESAWLFTGDSGESASTLPNGIWDSVRHDPDSVPANLLERAETYIFKRFRESLTVEDVAGHLGVSVRTLQRLFSQHGMNFRMYSNTVRLGIARHMLMSTDRPIKAIARETGFSGQARFTSMFRREFKVSPAGFRRLGRRKGKR